MGDIRKVQGTRRIILWGWILSGCFFLSKSFGQAGTTSDTIFCTHKVVLDQEHKILPWFTPAERAYDHFLHLRWNFIRTSVPDAPGPAPRSDYPQYYFYCAFVENNGVLEPDPWMNDIGEKIPNWFENARLYYAYTGDSGVMKLVGDFVDYFLEHGISPPDFSWPSFPYTTTNAGDTLFRGFSDHPEFVLARRASGPCGPLSVLRQRHRSG